MRIRRRNSLSDDRQKAEAALAAARAQLEEIKKRETEVAEVAEASRKFRKENHFAQDLQQLFEGGK